jgi:hypothetical protein
MSLFFDNHVLLEAGEKATLTSWSHNEFNMLLAIATDLPRIIIVGEEGNLLPEHEIRRGKN